VAPDVSAAASVLRGVRRILAFTGAGISTESGIPDFRGPNGVWNDFDPADFTIERYLEDGAVRRRRWRIHQQGILWGARSAVEPNQAHVALTRLARAGRLAGCVTQNVDGLHQRAGLGEEEVAELHGNVRSVRCWDCRRTWAVAEVLARVDAGDDDPHCLECGGILKTATVLFGETIPADQFERAMAMAAGADAVLVIGSTGSVYPAADVALSVVDAGGPMVIVNLGPTEFDRLAACKLDGPAGALLPVLADELLAPQVTGSPAAEMTNQTSLTP
jgi:NAD-dependent deacetylase